MDIGKTSNYKNVESFLYVKPSFVIHSVNKKVSSEGEESGPRGRGGCSFGVGWGLRLKKTFLLLIMRFSE